MTPSSTHKTVVIGAGIAGLAAALRLAHAGRDVTVVEQQSTPGGKMRTVPSVAGPVDAGPTVLTMRPVFEELFASVGEALSDHVTLTPLNTLARHHWDDGTALDLMANEEESRANIACVFGSKSARDYERFARRTRRLFEAFDAPMMQTATPSHLRLTGTVLTRPHLIRDMAPHKSLMQHCKDSFSEPKLAQLFARYATYVGGLPTHSPALLSLIAHSEARGVWSVKGGMHKLAAAIAHLAAKRGAQFQYSTKVQEIEIQNGQVRGLHTSRGAMAANTILFNGDPRALERGLLGRRAQSSVPRHSVEERSLSAWVHAFAATPQGTNLAYHTVFFGNDPDAEWQALSSGQTPKDATLYVCAQDRASPDRRPGPERFEIILNGPPLSAGPDQPEDIDACQTQVFSRLADFNLTFDRPAGPTSLTTPQSFAKMFPGSAGSLYGRSPHGMTAGLKRPTARTKIVGLYLCGGGAHPGAGVPMATLSARHAVEAILADQTLTSRSRQMATPGGTSTASATMANAPSQSSVS